MHAPIHGFSSSSSSSSELLHLQNVSNQNISDKETDHKQEQHLHEQLLTLSSHHQHEEYGEQEHNTLEDLAKEKERKDHMLISQIQPHVHSSNENEQEKEQDKDISIKERLRRLFSKHTANISKQSESYNDLPPPYEEAIKEDEQDPFDDRDSRFSFDELNSSSVHIQLLDLSQYNNNHRHESSDEDDDQEG